MKICRECGTPSPEATVFCPICGTKFPVKTLHFDRGYESSGFVSENDSLEIVLDNPAIFITDMDIDDVYSILPLLEESVKDNTCLLVIAKSFDEQVVDTLVLNKQRGNLVSVAVRAPGFAERKIEMLKDIAILTGGEVISPDNGYELKDATLYRCGQAISATITKDETTIIGGNGSQDEINDRIAQIKELISVTQSEYDREKTKERLVDLFGVAYSELQTL